MSQILPPTQCPACSSHLVWKNHLLYCVNTNCGSQMQKKLEHFAKTLKIKGLGPSAITKLGLDGISDIYNMSVEEIAECLSSQKLAEKLYSEIENSRSAPLDIVLPAFSIPLIGKSATEKLSTVCNHISEIDENNCQRAGLGPKATDNLLSWLKEEYFLYDGILPFDFKFKRTTNATTVATKGVVCISGKLKSFKSKAEATKALQSAGYEVKPSMTKLVTILINESGIESSKTQKARDAGVQIITNLNSLLEK